MEIKTDPKEIWSEYKKLTEYLTQEGVYENVKKNEKFFRGYQWGEGTGSILAKPTMNKLQHIGKYQVACIVSDDVGFTMTSLLANQDENARLKTIVDFVKDAIEQSKIQEKSRQAVQFGFIDGASYMLQTFNPDVETGQASKGMIDNQIVNMNQVLFGNQFSNDIQKQPYIIIALRQYIGEVKREAEELGMKPEDVDAIKGDANYDLDEDKDAKLCTVLLKFYKKKGVRVEKKVSIDQLTGMEIAEEIETPCETVFFTKTTQDLTLIPETDLGYTRYPLVRFGWEARRNSYLFDSPITSNIVNQIFINKLYAYCHEYMLKSAVPKTIVDETKTSIEDFENNSTFGIASIDLMGKMFDVQRMPDFSAQAIPLIQQTESEMKENMGVNDAALGNVRPDNAQAILQLQQSATIPITLQQNGYRDMWEDIVRNLVDMMTVNYGVRQIADDEGNIITVDFAQLKGLAYKLNVDTGSSSQYSEIAQFNTASQLLQQGLIDLETFTNVVSDKVLGHKEAYRKMIDKQNQAAMQSVMNTPTM